MIRQNNIYKRYFDIGILALTLFAALEVPLHLTLKYPPSAALKIIYLFYPIFFSIDIIVTFFTTITIDGEEVRDRKTIALKYLRTWFIIDLIAALPFDLFFTNFLAEMSNAARSLRLFSPRFIQILLLFRFLSIYHILPFLEKTRRKELLNPGVMRLIFTIFVVLVIAHWISCGWMALGKIDPNQDFVTNYIRALYWCITTITTIGYGDITPSTNIQTIYTMSVQLVGAGMYGYIIGNLASLLANSDLARTQFRAKLEKITTFMQYRDIPSELQENIKQYYDYLWNNRRGFDESTVLEELPSSLKIQVALHLNKEIIEKVPMFRGATEDLIRQIVISLKPALYTPGDYIFRKGEIGEQMFFISRGTVEIVSEDGATVYATLTEGSYFGEIALLLSSERTASVRAKEYCDVYTLDKQTFDRVLSKFPDIAKSVNQMAIERQKQMIKDSAQADQTSVNASTKIEKLTASHRGHKIEISWQGLGSVLGYQITRWDDSRGKWVFLSRSVADHHFIDIAPLQAMTNTYRIRSVTETGHGDWSVAVHVNPA